MSIIVTEGMLDWALALRPGDHGSRHGASTNPLVVRWGVRCKTSVEVIGGPIIAVAPGSVWRGAFDLIYSRDILIADDAPEFVAMPQAPGEDDTTRGPKSLRPREHRTHDAVCQAVPGIEKPWRE